MRVEEVKDVLVGADATEALFTCGERPDSYDEFRSWLNDIGYSNFIDYLCDLCGMAIELGLLPHTNTGVLTYGELSKLRSVNASMGLMLETTAKLEAHRDSPGKAPDLRLKTIEDAGRLRIPFTTGILVGIGESWDDRIDSLLAISDLHERYSHIQEVIIQPFTPKPFTPMGSHRTPTIDTMKKVVAIAREILPQEIAIQVPPNLIPVYELILNGANDLGGISQKTVDHINPESRWPSVEELEEMVHGIPLRERLPIYPAFIEKKWYSRRIGELIERHI
jgi:FO synthase subunit 1